MEQGRLATEAGLWLLQLLLPTPPIPLDLAWACMPHMAEQGTQSLGATAHAGAANALGPGGSQRQAIAKSMSAC